MAAKGIKASLIAPCGMNCALCIAYIREKNQCPGCRTSGKDFHAKCIIKNCKMGLRFCSSRCKLYPCKRLKSLDKRYRTRYGMSMIENLENIKKNGTRKFIKQEKKKWMKTGKVFCVHRKKYYDL